MSDRKRTITSPSYDPGDIGDDDEEEEDSVGGGSSGPPEDDNDDDDLIGGGSSGRTTPDDDDPRLGGGSSGPPEDDNDDDDLIGGGSSGRTTPDDDDPRLPDSDSSDSSSGGSSEDDSDDVSNPAITQSAGREADPEDVGGVPSDEVAEPGDLGDRTGGNVIDTVDKDQRKGDPIRTGDIGDRISGDPIELRDRTLRPNEEPEPPEGVPDFAVIDDQPVGNRAASVEVAADRLDEQTESDVEPEDVQVDPETGFARLKEDAIDEEQQERQSLDLEGEGNRREVAALEQAAEQLDEQTTTDVGIGDVQVDPETGEAELTPDAREREVEQQLAEERAEEAFGAGAPGDPADTISSSIADEVDVSGVSINVSSDLREEFSTGGQTDPVAAADAQGAGQTDPVARTDAEAARERAAEDRAVEQVEQNLANEFGVPAGAIGLLNLEEGDEITVEETDDGVEAGLSEEFEREGVQSQIISRLERETGADLSEDDVVIEETEDGELRGRLSEQGQETVELQNTPLRDTPLGGITTTGTRARVAIRDATDPVAETFRETTPSKDDVFGAFAGAAVVAGAEPTPIGEIGLGTAAAGAGLVAGGALVASAVRGDDPQAETTSELPVGGDISSEIEEPESAPEESGELEPGEPGVNELEVPEEGEQRIAPEELGVDREELRDGKIPVDGPEGTRITDDGDLVVPDGTGLVANAAQAEQKEKEEEEEEEEEEDEDEDEDEDDDESREEFLDRVSPDETVVIGEPAEGTDESEESGEQVAPVFPEQGQQEDDAEADEQEDGDFDDEELLPTQGTVVDDAEPEDWRSERDERLLEERDETLEEESTSLRAIGAAGTGLGLPEPELEGALGGDREREQSADLLGDAQSPDVDDATADLAGDQAGSLSATQSGALELSLSGAFTGDLSLEAQGQQVGQQEEQLQQKLEETTQRQQTKTETAVEQLFENAAGQGVGFGVGSRFKLKDLDGGSEGSGGGVETEESEPDAIEGELTSGFLNEFTAQLAGVDRSAPGEDELEEIAAGRVTNEALPTEGELEDSEAFGEAAGLLSGEGTGFGFDFGFGSDEDDGGGFNLL